MAEKDVWLVHYRCQAIDNRPDIPFDMKNWKVFSTEASAEKYRKKWNKENTCYTWAEVIKIKQGG